MRISKIYTRTGDAGDTGLVGKGRVPKDSPRVEAYGTIDELNSILGVVRAYNDQGPKDEVQSRLDAILDTFQQWLFDFGSSLATAPGSEDKNKAVFIKESQVQWLEDLIDHMNQDLEPLKSFVLPGGGPMTAHLHQCRTVCRRAERLIISLNRDEPLSEWSIPFINRLSDAFFVLCRWVSIKRGEEERLWKPGQVEPPELK